jgi:hypothetical protein
MLTSLVVNRYKFTRQDAEELTEATGSQEAALDCAIDAARERARLYYSPCTWCAHFNSHGEIIVLHAHIRKPKENRHD